MWQSGRMSAQTSCMNHSMVLGFAAVSVAIIAVPGPSVLFAVSRAISGGRRQALLTVLGNAAGLFTQVVLVALGLGVIVTGSDAAYTTLKLAGATYLGWLGVSTIRHRGATAEAMAGTTVGRSNAPFRDGFVVGVTNPKSFVFLAALLPQYIAPAAGTAAAQMVLLGGVFCVIAIACDGAWALAAARARTWLSSDPHRLSRMSAAGGLAIIGLGLLLATSAR